VAAPPRLDPLARAGTWSANRDLVAARLSWQQARQVAERLPIEDPDRTAMQIAPRSPLCGTAWRASGGLTDTGFEELRDLCAATGDKVSLAIGMAGQVLVLSFQNGYREASRLGSELAGLVESIGDPTLTVALLFAACYAKGETGEVVEELRLTQRIIDLADGDPTMGDLILRRSPLATATTLRGTARLCLGIKGWREDFDAAIAMGASVDPLAHVAAILFKYVIAIPIGALPPDATALRDSADALAIAERFGDDFTLGLARGNRGVTLVHHDGPDRDEGLALLTHNREAAVKEQFTMVALAMADPAWRASEPVTAISMVRSSCPARPWTLALTPAR
jgi:adenylate cyclase